MIKLTIDGKDYDSYVFKPRRVGGSYIINIVIENTYLHNISLSDEYSEDEELKIKSFTPKLLPKQKGNIILVFSPTKDRPQPCDCKWGFKTVVIG